MRKRNLWVSGRSIIKVKFKNGILASRRILSKTRLIAMGVMCAALVAVPLMTRVLTSLSDLDLSFGSRCELATDTLGLDDVGASLAVEPAGKIVVAEIANLPRVIPAPPPGRGRKAFALAGDKERGITACCERWRDFL